MKRTLVVLVAFAGLSGLAACGSDSTSSSTVASTAAAPTTAVVPTSAAPTTVVATTVVATTAAVTTVAVTNAAVTNAAVTNAAPTTVRSSTTAGGASTTAPVTITDPDAKAAADAYELVFDSTVAFDEKAVHLADATSLQTTMDAYADAGSQMGGIALEPTAATVIGTDATVTYDVLFGGTAAYRSLEGHIAKVGDAWQVSKQEFCSFMAEARTPCPA
jgi:hypothetical protein